MEPYSLPLQIRWSDLDPNFHLRHSVYYDWGALCRIQFLESGGLTARLMEELAIGPILFREECVFRKEIRSTDTVHINLEIIKGKKDFSRWSIQHQVIKNENILCAVLTVDGAWMDIKLRKLATPPAAVMEVFDAMPKAAHFAWLD